MKGRIKDKGEHSALRHTLVNFMGQECQKNGNLHLLLFFFLLVIFIWTHIHYYALDVQNYKENKLCCMCCNSN